LSSTNWKKKKKKKKKKKRNCNLQGSACCLHLASCLVYSPTPKFEALPSPEMSVNFHGLQGEPISLPVFPNEYHIATYRGVTADGVWIGDSIY
jgi:hypothetical protein